MQFGRYTLERRLAVGGMAELFLAYIEGPDRFRKRIVIKRILPHLLDEPAYTEMFIDEARLAARFTHPNLMQVYELLKIDGQYCFAMEYLAGKNLQEIIQASVERALPMPLPVASFIIGAVARGLHYAHDLEDESGVPLDVVHRDVSPANVIITTHGEVKVVDFGIAKHADRMAAQTTKNVLKGKFMYMSPEQGSGRGVDRRSDIFSLGIVMYELLTGKNCFGHLQTVESLLYHVRGARFEPIRTLRPDLPKELEKVINTMMALDPSDRYPTAAEAERALARTPGASGVTATDLVEYVDEIFRDDHPDDDATTISVPPTASSDLAVAVSGRWADPEVDIDRRGLATILGNIADEGLDGRFSGLGTFVYRGADRVRNVVGRLFGRGSTPLPSDVDSLVSRLVEFGWQIHSRPWLRALAYGALIFGVGFAVLALIYALRMSEHEDYVDYLEAPMIQENEVAGATLEPEPVESEGSSAEGSSAGPVDSVSAAEPKPTESPGSASPDAGPPGVPPRATAESESVAPSRTSPASGKASRAKRRVGTLTIESQPRADVWIGGKKIGSTPLRSYSVPAGTVEVMLRAPKMGIQKSVRVKVPAGGSVKRRVVWGKGTVRLNVRPWADVYLNGKKLGTTPMQPLTLYEGRHELHLVNPETGKKRTVRVLVRAGETSKVIESLE